MTGATAEMDRVAVAVADAGGSGIACRPLGWLAEELDAWDVPEHVPSSRWVQDHVVIPEGVAALPGPLDLRLTPYALGILDALDDPDVDTVTLVCGTQLGKSTMLYAWMLSTLAQWRAPLLLVMPAEDDARSVAGDTLRKYVQACGPVHGLLADGESSLTREGFQFVGADWAFGWSNSPASLARRARRICVYDEVEKYPPWVGRESTPVKIGDARLRTYRETTGAKSVRVSSPTVPEGEIWTSYQASDRRTYWVPCPACGEYQPLIWSQVRWPHDAETGRSLDGETIDRRNLARYVCRHCSAEWNDAKRYDAVRSGVWARSGQRVRRDGAVVGDADRPAHHHAGFHLPALASLFTRLGHLVREWLEVCDDPILAQSFVNQELGEVWAEIETEVKAEPLSKHTGSYVMGTAPHGVQIVTAGVDVQRGWYVVEARGWGYGLESWVLEAMVVQTDDQLHEWLRDRRFTPLAEDGKPLLKPNGKEPAEPLAIRTALIDAGDQTADIYDLVHAWSDIDLRPSMGQDVTASALKLQARPIARNPRTGRAYAVRRLRYDFEALYWKDTQARLAGIDTPGPGYLHLPANLPSDWMKQFLAEAKVVDRKRGKTGRSGRPIRIWKPRTREAANHYWDCAILNCVLTDPQLLNLRALPDPSVPPPPAGSFDRHKGPVYRIRTKY